MLGTVSNYVANKLSGPYTCGKFGKKGTNFFYLDKKVLFYWKWPYTANNFLRPIFVIFLYWTLVALAAREMGHVSSENIGRQE